MKKVLLLSPFFYPEPISTGKYNSILAKEIISDNTELDVFCFHPLYPQWKIERSNKKVEGVNIFRGGEGLRFPSNPLLRRAVLEISFLIYIFYKLLFSRKKYTHIVSIFPPSLFMFAIPFIKGNAKVVGIVHDLQGVYANNNAGIAKKMIFRLIKWTEKISFNKCDKLIFLSEDMKNKSEEEYQLDKNCNEVYYPFVTIDKFYDGEKLNDIFEPNKKSIVYSGALGEKQAPYKLAKFMSSFVNENPDYRAYIFSQGPVFDELKDKFKGITFNPLVDEDVLPELLLKSTIQILPQETGTSDGSLPSKLPNLLASKCKILCITDPGSELVRLLKSYSLASVTHGWESKALVNVAKELDGKSEICGHNDELLMKFQKSELVKSITS